MARRGDGEAREHGACAPQLKHAHKSPGCTGTTYVSASSGVLARVPASNCSGKLNPCVCSRLRHTRSHRRAASSTARGAGGPRERRRAWRHCVAPLSPRFTTMTAPSRLRVAARTAVLLPATCMAACAAFRAAMGSTSTGAFAAAAALMAASLKEEADDMSARANMPASTPASAQPPTPSATPNACDVMKCASSPSPVPLFSFSGAGR